MSNYLYACHDASADWAGIIRDFGVTGWAIQSEEIGDDPNDHSGNDYTYLAAYGVTPIVRLNYSHHGEGTIPLPNRYYAFAERSANFVTASKGCRHWIIGNEPNLRAERYADVPITPGSYAECFNKCRSQILHRSTQNQVIPAAIAPYNADTGWCLDYWREMLSAIVMTDGGADGLALHTYSRGSNPASITSDDKMDAPYQTCYNGFRAYRDFLAFVPFALRGLPVYITETDQLKAWADANSGWVQSAYAEINHWNGTTGHQGIHCLALYRWENYDQWGFCQKNGVIDDFRGALTFDFEVPSGDPARPTPPQPTPPEPEPPEPAPAPLYWDERLTVRGCTLQKPLVAAGEKTQQVTVGRWFDEDEAEGRVNIFVRLLDENGQLATGIPVTQFWPGGSDTKLTERKSDPWLEAKGLGADYSLDFAMYEVAPSYGIRIDDGHSNDLIDGCGLGSIEQPDYKIHTAYFFEWQLSSGESTVPPTTPTDVETGRVSAPAGLHVRSGPGTQFAVLGTLAYDSTVLYDGSVLGWQHLVEGWVSAEYVEPATAETEAPIVRGRLIWPVQGAVITQRFGQNYEYYLTTFGAEGHNGVDFGLVMGSPIYATADGIVTMVDDDKPGYGLFVRLYHPQFRLGSLYAHCDELLVRHGESVVQGQQIATVGSSGNSSGPHCHWELCAQDESGYINVTYGHSKGRSNPEVIMYLLGTPSTY